ncbi:MAG: hypothetical protein NTW87_03260 [Planctomycetota bacterium]|nr:hypothetical protein [Planctomycetota bacterium]
MRTVAAVTIQCDLRVWDADTGKELFWKSHIEAGFTLAAFSPDSAYLAVGGQRRAVCSVFDARSGEILKELPAHDTSVRTVCFSSDGTIILTASQDTGKRARLWDWRNGKELQTFVHKDRLWSASFSPDGKRVLTGTIGKEACLWSAETGSQLAALGPHNDLVCRGGDLSRDGRFAVTLDGNSAVGVWDVERQVRCRFLDFGPTTNVCRAWFACDDKTISVWLSDGTMRTYNLDAVEVRKEPMPVVSAVCHADVSSDNRHVVSVDTEVPLIRLWDRMSDYPDGRPLRHMPGFWLTLLFGLTFVWSVWRDRKTL